MALDPERYKVGDRTEQLGLPKLQISAQGEEGCETFVLGNEDHTLGNSLRYMLSKNPEVQFTGYAAPHPSEKKINLRVQMKPASQQSPNEALRAALNNIVEMSNVVIETFEASIQEYDKANEDKMQE